jgi:hypothetical protein
MIHRASVRYRVCAIASGHIYIALGFEPRPLTHLSKQCKLAFGCLGHHSYGVLILLPARGDLRRLRDWHSILCEKLGLVYVLYTYASLEETCCHCPRFPSTIARAAPSKRGDCPRSRGLVVKHSWLSATMQKLLLTPERCMKTKWTK